jgi:hypothetical protein
MRFMMLCLRTTLSERGALSGVLTKYSTTIAVSPSACYLLFLRDARV